MKTIGLLERASRGTRVREGEVRVVHIERSAVRVVPEGDAESLSSRGIEQSTSGENAEVHSYRLSCPLAVTRAVQTVTAFIKRRVDDHIFYYTT